MVRPDESRFEQIAGETLDTLFDRLEEGLDQALGARADVDLQEGILSIDIDGSRRWIINKNAVSRQLWLSSPVSGAAHFDWDGAGWVGTRGEGSLFDRLQAELSGVAGREVVLT